MPEVKILLEAHQTAFNVTVEPWAAPAFEIRPNERCAVIVRHPKLLPTATLSVVAGEMLIMVYEGGCTFSFVRGASTEFGVPEKLAIPEFPTRRT